MVDRLRNYLPNCITFISLACGVLAIYSTFNGNLHLAGLFILGSAILDSLDGYLARKLNAQSKFGLQLDSLADMVSQGIAPLVLTYFHLNKQGFTSSWIILPLIILTWTSAYRLARFNLQPKKSDSNSASLGLTTGQAGVTLALAVLSDLSLERFSIPFWMYILLILALSFLMASRINIPAVAWFVQSRIPIFVILSCGIIFLLFFPPYTTLLIIWIGNLVYSIARTLYRDLFQQSPIS